MARSPEQQEQEHFERRVMVDEKHLGMETDEFSLDNIANPENMLGGDAFTEVYFKTKSGNIYKILKIAATEEDIREFSKSWVLINGKENEGKGVIKTATLLNEQDLTSVLKTDNPFIFHSGNTTEVAEILCVNGNRIYIQEYLKKLTEGRTSSIVADFKKIIEEKK